MKLKYLRLHIFQILLRPISRYARARRMREFSDLMELCPAARVLDLGGRGDTWDTVACPLNITIFNLPGEIHRSEQTHHEMRYVEGDACDLDQFQQGEFDIVFSNSVIEHVGPDDRQKLFASEVHRVGKKFWIQTPSKWFPIEAHCGMPFWWFYPECLRRVFLRRWQKKLAPWTEMVENTRVLARRQFMRLFPQARIRTERLMGLPKSYVVYYLGSPRH